MTPADLSIVGADGEKILFYLPTLPENVVFFQYVGLKKHRYTRQYGCHAARYMIPTAGECGNPNFSMNPNFKTQIIKSKLQR